MCSYKGTHISNTREAKAFALLSEEGIAKGIRRVTAVTTDYASKALELASLLEQEVNEASKLEGSLLEQVLHFIPGLCNFTEPNSTPPLVPLDCICLSFTSTPLHSLCFYF